MATPESRMLSTLTTLRVNMGILALAFPPLLWLGGWFFGFGLQRSMSVYYHTPMRNAFVGILFAIGAFLYLYRGFSQRENLSYNLAGLFAIGIVFFPIDIPPELTQTALPVYTNRAFHLVCATGFFLVIAYACLYAASGTLQTRDNRQAASRYRYAYRLIGAALIVLPFVAMACDWFEWNRSDDRVGSLVFFLEAAAVWIFGAFWILQNVQIRQAHLDERLLSTD